MSGTTSKGWDRQQMADRLAREFQDGWIVNLGVGIPTLCSNTDIGDRDITYHAELTRACRDGDAARARQLIIEHTEQVRRLVRNVIDQAGGAL